MSSRYLQCCFEKRRGREVLEAHHRMSDGKFIATVQICLRCGRKSPLKKGHKHCPHCQGLLRIRTIILKAP